MTKEYTVEELMSRLVEAFREGFATASGANKAAVGSADDGVPLGPLGKRPMFTNLFVGEPAGLYFLTTNAAGETQQVGISEVGIEAICAYLTDIRIDEQNEYNGKPSPKVFFGFRSRKPAGDVLEWDLGSPAGYGEMWNFSIRSSICHPELGGSANTFTRLSLFHLGAVYKARGLEYLQNNPLVISNVHAGDKHASSVLASFRFFDVEAGRTLRVEDIIAKSLDWEAFKKIEGDNAVWYDRAVQIGTALRGESGEPDAQPAG